MAALRVAPARPAPVRPAPARAPPRRSACSSCSASIQLDSSSPPRSCHFRNARSAISSLDGAAGCAAAAAFVARDLPTAVTRFGDRRGRGAEVGFADDLAGDFAVGAFEVRVDDFFDAFPARRPSARAARAPDSLFVRFFATDSSCAEAYRLTRCRAAAVRLRAVRLDSARQAALGLLCVGFEGDALDERTASLLRDGTAGVVLFARNFVDRAQVASLCADIRGAAAGRAVIIAVDHEGGRVQRFRGTGFTDLPSARSAGSAGDAAAVRRIAEIAARELRAVGITMDFAPVLDVDSNPANPVIGDRSYSTEPRVVAELGAEFIDALQSNGIAACGKHFPGHGDTVLDSHLDLPRLPHDRARLDAVELPPFRAAIAAGVASIMTAHVVFEALDPGVPATMSRAVIDGLLRRELGFDGVIVSDDLDMKAIADRFEVGEAAVRATDAGCDLLLCCRSQANRDRALEALGKGIVDGLLDRSRVEQSLARVAALAARYQSP